MYYELSNVIFNRKLKNVRINHPFVRKNFSTPAFKHDGKSCFYAINDKPHNLFNAFRLGLSMKPMAFNHETLDRSDVKTIILDFDNLTEVQYNFVKSIVNGKYKFIDAYGDDSAGMKTWFKDNEDIPNAKPDKWKYKVFFPCEETTICTFKSVKEQFIKATSLFNPIFPIEKVEEVFNLWLKACNRKDKINNPIFNGWILPDVAMLNSFRTQITYGCDTSLNKATFIPYEEWYSEKGLYIVTTIQRSTNKFDYSGLDWKDDEPSRDVVNDIYKDKRELDVKKLELESDIMSKAMSLEYDWLKKPFHYPLCKSDFAHKLNRNKFIDLVIPAFNPNAMIYSTLKNGIDLTIDVDKFIRDIRDYSTTIGHLAMEYKHQGGLIEKNKVIEDVIHLFQTKHGVRVFRTINRIFLKKLSKEMASSLYNAMLNHGYWRIKQKFGMTTSNPDINNLLVEYHRTKDKAYLNKYLVERKKDSERRMNEGEVVNMPYIYQPKGLKKNVIENALSTCAVINNVDEWVEWCSLHMEHFNDYDVEKISKWFYDYSKKKGLKLDNARNSGKGKWSERFQGLNELEIEGIINQVEDRKMRCYLKQRFLTQT